MRIILWQKRGVKIERKLSFKRKRKKGRLFNNSSGHLLGFEPIVIELTTIYMLSSTSSFFSSLIFALCSCTYLQHWI